MKTRLALLLCVAAVSGCAQSRGTFTATTGMVAARSGHTATVLPNGTVLIAGGENSPQTVDSHALASAELYDPSIGFSTRTGDMITARYGHSAALLPDGRVLISGGYAPTSTVSSTEIFDPSTGTFTATGGTSTVSGIATLLKNGKVLIAGNTAELYDPVTDSFALTGSYVGPFYYGPFFYPDSATLLQDGRVLIVGSACGDCWLEHEEVYDPVTGTFKAVGELYTCSSGCAGYIWSAHSATLLQNGKVLLAGGVSEDFGTFSNAELYDPSTDTIAPTGNMNLARAGHTATLLTDGTVLVAGGQFDSFPLIDVELYNPATGTFSYTGHMTIPRSGHSAALLFDGRVLTSGGVAGSWLNSADLYTPQLLAPAPALFSLSGDGAGQGAIWHADTGKIASSANPATAGDGLSMYTTSLFEGGAIFPQIAIGGQPAVILFFGDAPGYPGYDQVNFRMPSGVAPGSAVSVRLNYLGRPSNAVTIGVQ
jgi:hypothetical protein